MKKLVLFVAVVAVVSFASCKKEQKETGVIEAVIEQVEEVTDDAPEDEAGEIEAVPSETPAQ